MGLSTERGGSSPKLKRKSKPKKKFLALQEAIQLPIEVAIIHGNVCQKENPLGPKETEQQKFGSHQNGNPRTCCVSSDLGYSTQT